MKILLLGKNANKTPGAAVLPDRLARMKETLEVPGVDVALSHAGDLERFEKDLEAAAPNLVFSSLHQLPNAHGGKVNLHDWLDERGLPYVGSPGSAIDLCLFKPGLKARWERRDIPTPRFFYEAITIDAPTLFSRVARAGARFPFIVKPAREGNSRGIDASSIAGDPEALYRAVSRTLAEFGEALIEEFLGARPGLREFTVAMLGPDHRCLPCEILLPSGRVPRLVTTKDKNEHTAVAAPVDDRGLRLKIADFAALALGAAGLRDYARIDILMDGRTLYAIEINGQPMLPDPWFDACVMHAGYAPFQAVQTAFASAILRHRGAGFQVPGDWRPILP
jgi:D-alanine-D-alanine ligase-like ATP-grasp enzyme